MSTLQRPFYDAMCAMLQDMRDYKAHGEWFKNIMAPILPIKSWEPIPWKESAASEKWHADGYGWENIDFYPYTVNGLLFYTQVLVSLDIMRGKRVEEFRVLISPYKEKLASFSAYFSLEKELAQDCFNVLLFVDRNKYGNHLFAEAVGRG